MVGQYIELMTTMSAICGAANDLKRIHHEQSPNFKGWEVMKKQDKSWDSHPIGRVYIGHEVQTNMIYIGGAYYQSGAQIHLTVKEAKWLQRHLEKALKRVRKEGK